jgi:putative addiction module component (TIGR02574 family)
MDIQTVKIDLIQWLTQVQDKTILEKLQNLKKEQGTLELSLEQQQELDERLANYESGNMKFSSWDTVKDRIRKRAKESV